MPTSQYVPDTQILDNQARAKALGVTIPGVEATPATAYKDFNIGANDPSVDSTLGALTAGARKDATSAIPTEEQAYRQKLSQFQKEIDATNSVYTQILADTKQQGVGRLGSGRAIQARSGLLGSDFASAQNDTITSANTDAENLVRAEQAAKIQALLGKARTDAVAEIAAKREARKAGAEDYLSYLASSAERKASKLAKVAGALLEQGIDVKDVDPAKLKQIAKDYGVAAEDITSAYNTEKTARETAQAEADAKAIKDNSFNLSEGQSYYAYDPKTGGYTQVASKAKTYAPKDGGTGITPLAGGESPFIAQPNYAKLGAKQRTQADSLNNLVRSLTEYEETFRNTVRPDGSQVFGDEAALLETKLNSIIFAAAQAEGTGALQQADREVIEKIIPNPTNLSALGAFTRGGKEGSIKRIQDQKNKYTQNLAGYGLVPVSQSSAIVPQDTTTSPPKGTDGEAYGYPGFVSDGEQWVEK